MMNERRRKRQILKVDHYDGQCIFSGRELYYELGGYLGGGAAGVVYEAFCARTKRHVAIKILNPVGYKLLPSTLLTRCVVAVQGKPLLVDKSLEHDEDDDEDLQPRSFRSPAFARRALRHMDGVGGIDHPAAISPMRIENVWWLIHPSTKQAVAAFEDPRTGSLRELSLPQCFDVWGAEFHADDLPDAAADLKFARLESATQEVQVKHQALTIPRIPKKFVKFVRTRRSIHREIANMSGLGHHENVLRLDEALELVQDSKCTTFLVLELAAGGELFDRIKLDCGTDEDTARRYFQQLISGVAFCHVSGVCHRDLKPENLLLADSEECSTLKIADFGLSAIFAMTEHDAATPDNATSTAVAVASVQAIRRLRSVVGSPHYVAPEVLMDAGQGYDGAKADAWSIGVIVYAMLAGNLPFGKDLLKCLRYEKFKKWCYNTKYSDEDPVDEVAFPSWFFPAHFSLEVKSLITQLLYPDPTMRLAVEEAQRHAWVLGCKLQRTGSSIAGGDSPNPDCLPAPGNSPLAAANGNANSNANANVNANVTRPGSTVVVNVPQNLIDQESQRWTSHQRSMPPSSSTSSSSTSVSPSVISPSSFSRLHHGRSPRQAGSGMSLCPPSPQKNNLRSHHLLGGYMPSVDETAPLAGQTPPVSPRHGNHDGKENARDGSSSAVPLNASPASEPLQFAMEPSTGTQKDSQGRAEFADAARECARQPSFVSTECVPQAANASANTNAQQRLQRRFTSPPLATGSRSSLLQRRHQHRRNSPPELFLSRYGKGIKFEAIQTTFDIDSDQFSASVSLASTPTDGGKVWNPQLSSGSYSVPNTPLAGSTKPTTGPPSYHDLVSRSTRFITALPAQLVLSNIETILTLHPSPLPHATPSAPQQVSIDWDNYQLEVRYGDVLTCTVQVFLFQRGVYLVEFRRGQVEIFQFKRFYEDMREKLSESMELSSQDAWSPRQEHPVGSPDALSPRPFPRKRNKSISVHDNLLR